MGPSSGEAGSTALGREQHTPMPFFPKDKQNLGIIWHSSRCQKLAFGEVGVVNIALPNGRVTIHTAAAADNRWEALVWLQCLLSLRLLCTHWRLALWGGIEHFLTLGHGALAHRDDQKDSQKCSKHFNCLDSATKYKRWLWSFMERCM